jgi:hypothetical protein
LSRREGSESYAQHGSHGYRERTRSILEQLSRAGPEGDTPALLGIDPILLERMVSRRLADRLLPLAPGASYSYRISEKGATFLVPRE